MDEAGKLSTISYQLSTVVATGENNEIGDGKDLLWHLPKDMKYFKELTWGHCVVMGRITYESIPERFRPLENRTNIVITRNKSFKAEEDVVIAHSLEEAFEKAKGKTFIIGGGQIYEQSLSFVKTIYLTKVHAAFPTAKTFFPSLDEERWKLIAEEFHDKDEKHKYDFSFQVFETFPKF